MKSLSRLAAAAALAAAASLTPVAPAEAGKNEAIAGAIIGGIALGAIITHKQHSTPHYYSSEAPRTCYTAPTQCRWVQKCWYDKWGHYKCANRQECFNPVTCY